MVGVEVLAPYEIIVSLNLVPVNEIPGDILGKKGVLHQHICIAGHLASRASKRLAEGKAIAPRIHRGDEVVVVGGSDACAAKDINPSFSHDHEMLEKEKILTPSLKGFSRGEHGIHEIDLSIHRLIFHCLIETRFTLNGADREEGSA